MSDYSSYSTYESEEEETSGWLLTSENSMDDDLSDELTLLNGDEDSDEDTNSFEALIQLSIRLKKEYNLREAAVQLERCDKIWDTIQIVKKMQLNAETDRGSLSDEDDDEDEDDGDDDDDDDDEEDDDNDNEKGIVKTEKPMEDSSNSSSPEDASSSVPYIKYQPVQGNGNTALPIFHLSVKSQQSLFHCVACGKQFSEKRSLRAHSMREHGIVIPKVPRKSRQSTETKIPGQDVNDNKIVNYSGSREITRSRLSNTSNNSTEQKSHRKRERDKIPIKLEPKKEPEDNLETLEDRVKKFSCRLCSLKYRYNRGVIKHMMNAHNMTLAEAGVLCDSQESSKPQNLLKIRDSKKLNMNTENSDISESSSSVGTQSNTTYNSYIYTCKTCGHTVTQKKNLKRHLFRFHNITISDDFKIPRRSGLLDMDLGPYTSRIKKHIRTGPLNKNVEVKPEIPIEENKKITRRYRRTDKNHRVSNSETSDNQRSRKSRKTQSRVDESDRPQRACAKNTTYTECTKEEEEVLHREILRTNSTRTQDSGKATNAETNRCFLCKKFPVDMEKHLQDYHKIKCLEKILPITENSEETEKTEKSSSDIQASYVVPKTSPKSRRSEKKTESNVIESYVEPKSSKSRRGRKKSNDAEDIYVKPKELPKSDSSKQISLNYIDQYVRILYNTMYRSVLCQKLYECTICCYKFGNSNHARRHLIRNSENGVIVNHLAPKQKGLHRRKYSRYSSASGSRRSTSKKSRKRKIHLTDEPDDRCDDKKRKIHGQNEFVDATSDAANDETDPLLIVNESQGIFDDPDKSDNLRDTRDSSDRDSGIGISITIKKRNNSYEVVEKDSGDDEKFKDATKNGNCTTSSFSESSSFNHTSTTFSNDDQETRRREILNSLNSSVEGQISQSLINVTDNDTTLSTNKTENKEICLGNEGTNLRLRESQDYREDKNVENSLGNVPSLKIMCKSVLKANYEIERLVDTLSHKCTVCHRFYPTEREMTVHMIEHKVNNIET